MTCGTLLMLAALALVAGVVLGPCWARLWLALMLIGTAAGLSAALQILGSVTEWEWRSTVSIGGEPFVNFGTVTFMKNTP